MALVGVGRNQSHIVGVILYGSSISTVTTVPPTAWSLRFWTLPWCYHSGRAETTHVARLPGLLLRLQPIRTRRGPAQPAAAIRQLLPSAGLRRSASRASAVRPRPHPTPP